MGVEVGIPYVLTGPDGTRAVFNDPADADFVGYLDGDGGISGLDSPEVRENADVRVEADGGVHGQFFYGRRPVVLTGWVYPDGATQATVNARIERLQRASNAMRADGELRWTETGSVERRVLVRRQQPLRIAGRRPKTFQVPLVCADAEVVAAAEQSLVIVSGATGFLGFTSPIMSPLASVIASGGGAFAVNSGTAPSFPRLRIDGPITNPRVLNNTTGEELRLIYDLAVAEWLEVDMKRRTVLLGGTANRYSAVEFPASVWWALQPGNNDIRLNATAASGGAQVTVYWRHAWI